MKIRVFGDGLDALILVYLLSNREISHEWVTTKDQPGGYFAGGRNCVGRPVDLGMVLLEPNSFNSKQIQLSEFDGEEGHSGRPYIDEAYSLLKEHFGESRIIPIAVRAKDGSSSPDYFISDSLNSLWQNDTLIPNQLLEKLEWLRTNPDWHPKNKHKSESVLSNIGLSSYYKKIYGEEIYERFFAGFLESLLGDKIDRLPASLHRRAWAPLYWPETLLGFLQKEITAKELFEPKFTRPKIGSVAKWVENMTEYVSKSGISEINKVERINPDEYDGFKSTADFAFLENSIFDDNVEKLGGVSPAIFIEIRIIHICVDQPEAKIIFLNGNENGCFRYSTESTSPLGIGGITLEFGDLSIKTDDETLILIALNMCRNFGYMPKCHGTLFKGKIPLNNPKKHLIPSKRPDTGNTFTFHNKTAMSINDNIVRGIGASLRIKRGKT